MLIYVTSRITSTTPVFKSPACRRTPCSTLRGPGEAFFVTAVSSRDGDGFVGKGGDGDGAVDAGSR